MGKFSSLNNQEFLWEYSSVWPRFSLGEKKKKWNMYSQTDGPFRFQISAQYNLVLINISLENV